MGFILGALGFVVAIIGIVRTQIGVLRGASRTFQNKAIAEFKKQKREKGWTGDVGPSQEEFVLDYEKSRKPGFMSSVGLIMLGVLLLVSSCVVPAG